VTYECSYDWYPLAHMTRHDAQHDTTHVVHSNKTCIIMFISMTPSFFSCSLLPIKVHAAPCYFMLNLNSSRITDCTDYSCILESLQPMLRRSSQAALVCDQSNSATGIVV
jgi:hypothetical protein